MARSHRLVVLQAAALGGKILQRIGPRLGGVELARMRPVLPAVTCTAQASFRTAALPREHGMVANGRWFGELAKVLFWEQSARLVAGRRIWEGFREAGGRVAMLFWQQSLGESADVVLSPAPIHKHGGGMIQDCYSRPAGLYRRLCDRIGRGFRLRHYWGPLASAKAGDWIAAATAAALRDRPSAPDLCLTYLPTLDYDLQRHGPGSAEAGDAAAALARQVDVIARAAEEEAYELLVFGDYAIAPCREAVFPNRALRDAGLMQARQVRGRLYPDLYASRAFAVVDHEIAHVHVSDPRDVEPAANVLGELPGVESVLKDEGKREAGLDHPHSGELVLIAAEGRWFAYPWWPRKRQEPDYAAHVDIHNKPGFDPCELWFGWPPPSVSRDTTRIRGTHGRADAGREVAWGATCALDGPIEDLIGLARGIGAWLEASE